MNVAVNFFLQQIDLEASPDANFSMRYARRCDMRVVIAASTKVLCLSAQAEAPKPVTNYFLRGMLLSANCLR